MKWSLLVGLMALLWTPWGLASQINYNSTASLVEEINRDSQGGAWDGNYLMDLGVFDAGFNPTEANRQLWAQHWHRAGRVSYNVKFRAFTGSYLVESNQGPFGIGVKGYLWIFNPAGRDGEWVLLSAPAWLWPDATNILGQPVSWSVAAATEVVTGQVNPQPGRHLISAAAGNAAPPLQSYAQWAALNFSPSALGNASALPNGDADGDGITNRWEFAYGLNPMVKNLSDEVPKFEVQRIGGVDCLALSILRQSERQVKYRVEASEDLLVWSAQRDQVRTITSTLMVLQCCDFYGIGVRGHRYLRLVVETY